MNAEIYYIMNESIFQMNNVHEFNLNRGMKKGEKNNEIMNYDHIEILIVLNF